MHGDTAPQSATVGSVSGTFTVDRLTAPWTCLYAWHNGNLYGSVPSIEEATNLIEIFAYFTSTSYVETRCSRDFGNFNVMFADSTHYIRFQDDARILRGSKIDLDGVPFMVVGSKVMECHQGPLRTTKAEHPHNDHHYHQQGPKEKPAGTKKIGCPASIYLREVITFPEYRVDLTDTNYRKHEMSIRLRMDLQSTCYEDIILEKKIFIDLPDQESHIGHLVGEAAMKVHIDDGVLHKTKKRRKKKGKKGVKELCGSPSKTLSNKNNQNFSTDQNCFVMEVITDDGKLEEPKLLEFYEEYEESDQYIYVDEENTDQLDAAKQVREACTKIYELSYLVQSPDAIENASRSLNDILQNLQSSYCATDT